MGWDIGPLKLAVLMVIGIVVLGPEKLAETVRRTRDTVRQVRAFVAQARTEALDELNEVKEVPEFRELRELRELGTLGADKPVVAALADEVRQTYEAVAAPPARGLAPDIERPVHSLAPGTEPPDATRIWAASDAT